MQRAFKTKLLMGILAALAALGVLIAHQVRVNQQAADAATKLAAEREKAAQVNRDDEAAVQKIRERNTQQTSNAPKQ